MECDILNILKVKKLEDTKDIIIQYYVLGSIVFGLRIQDGTMPNVLKSPTQRYVSVWVSKDNFINIYEVDKLEFVGFDSDYPNYREI